jgi:NAD(P)H dehydrogenase (quinone)
VILVTGATGQVGYSLLEHLDDLHAEVTAMVRVEARAADLPPGVQHLVGSFDDPPDPDALEGFDRIFLLSPAEEAQVELEVRFIDAIVAAGHSPWIVKIAADGFQDVDCGARFMRNHRVIAAHLDAIGLPVSYLAPSLYMENLLQAVDSIRTQATVPAPAGDARIGFIAAKDVAAVAAQVLTSDPPEPRIYSLTGPEALTYSDVAELVSAVFASTVDYDDQPPAQARRAFLAAGMTPWQADGQLELFDWARNGGYDYVTDEVRAVTGEAPRPVELWLEQARAAFLRPPGAPLPRF